MKREIALEVSIIPGAGLLSFGRPGEARSRQCPERLDQHC
jgi:hypothetical protein